MWENSNFLVNLTQIKSSPNFDFFFLGVRLDIQTFYLLICIKMVNLEMKSSNLEGGEKKEVIIKASQKELAGLRTKIEWQKKSEKFVKNQSYVMGKKVGVYEWELNDKYSQPSGRWRFQTNDSLYVWKFDEKWFISWFIESKDDEWNNVKYDVSRQNGNMVWTARLWNIKYEWVWNHNMELKECTYKNIKLKLTNSGWQYFIVNENGDRLKLNKKADVGVIAARIAYAISIVKYSGKRLDYFEADGPFLLQADYANAAIDTDLYKNTIMTLWIDARELAERLNKSRSEWWI